VAIARYYEKTDLERMLGSRVDLVRIRDGMNSLRREWSMVNVQWSMVNGQWSMVNGQILPISYGKI